MKNTLFIIFVLFSIFANAQEKPNIIFILIDDLGKEWINCYGAEGIETPNIDKLAKEGTKFNNAYSMPQCTPSRVCFLTGQYPYKNGWVNHWDSPRWGNAQYDSSKNPSIGKTMKNAGYKTASAGKWQLNDLRVEANIMKEHGFDESFMWTGAEYSKDKQHTKKSSLRYWNPYINTNGKSKTYEGAFGPDLYNDFVLNFIDENKNDPFFIYYPMALTHGPFTTTPHEPNVTSAEDKHKAMVRYADFLLGKIMHQLEKTNLRENTLIIWTCDNGSGGRMKNKLNGRLVRGGKTKTTENGVNTPFIVSCPGLVPQNKTSDALVDFTDMLPTFADFGNVKPNSNYEYNGVSLKKVFTGEEDDSDREWILAMGSKPAVLTDKGVENVYYFRDRVVRGKRFKLFINTKRKPEKLIDLKNDPAEINNLIEDPKYKEILTKLSAIIKELPKKDNDPNYTNLEGFNYSSKKLKLKSQIHKKDTPELK